jgi:hypothetical protein
VLRAAEAVNSPWRRLTLDTGNSLEQPYRQMEAMAASPVGSALGQAKTYLRGGRWYELDLDCGRIAGRLRRRGYRGRVSPMFEGNEAAGTVVPRSLALQRKHFSVRPPGPRPVTTSPLRRTQGEAAVSPRRSPGRGRRRRACGAC